MLLGEFVRKFAHVTRFVLVADVLVPLRDALSPWFSALGTFDLRVLLSDGIDHSEIA